MAAIIVGPTNWQPQAAEEYRVQVSSLGDQMITGGYLICRSGGSVAWIVAPASSEVIRNWYSRYDAITTATNCTSATGWFVPTIDKLRDPGYCCKTYWDSSPSADYWSDTGVSINVACGVKFSNGAGFDRGKTGVYHVRALRCVIY